MIKKHDVNLLSAALFSLCFYVFCWVVRPGLVVVFYEKSPIFYHVTTLLFSFFYSILIIIVFDTIEWEKQQRRLNLNFKFKTLYITIIVVFAGIRLCFFLSNSHNSFSVQTLVTLVVSSILEELLTKCILLRFLKTKKMSMVLKYLLICLIFAFSHIDILTAPFPVARIVGLIIFQMVTILLYELYPSFVITSVYHFIVDLFVYL